MQLFNGIYKVHTWIAVAFWNRYTFVWQLEENGKKNEYITSNTIERTEKRYIPIPICMWTVMIINGVLAAN